MPETPETDLIVRLREVAQDLRDLRRELGRGDDSSAETVDEAADALTRLRKLLEQLHALCVK